LGINLSVDFKELGYKLLFIVNRGDIVFEEISEELFNMRKSQ